LSGTHLAEKNPITVFIFLKKWDIHYKNKQGSNKIPPNVSITNLLSYLCNFYPSCYSWVMDIRTLIYLHSIWAVIRNKAEIEQKRDHIIFEAYKNTTFFFVEPRVSVLQQQ